MSPTERALLRATTDQHAKIEIYSGVARLARAVWASEVRPSGPRPEVAVMICHPTANFLGHYALEGLARRGMAGIGLTTRYVGNDTSLIMENCLLDMGAMVRHLRKLGYRKVVIVGNSGGASIVPFYQAQAEHPTITDPPGGGPDLTQAGLVPGDALVMFNAHPSRALLSTEWLDPAIIDETQPFERDPELDMFRVGNGPPYSSDFVTRYRAAQLARNRRITTWVQGQLRALQAPGHYPPNLDDLAFVVHGTNADLRFFDGALDPNDRLVGVSLHGSPEIANYLPAAISRTTTLRAWLNQWSVDHTNADSRRWLPQVSVPVLIEYGSADPTVLPHMGRMMYDAARQAETQADRSIIEIPAGTHYWEDQPELLEQAIEAMTTWIRAVV